MLVGHMKESSLIAAEQALKIKKCMGNFERYLAEETRTKADGYLAQLEDSVSGLCHASNGVVKAAIQLIAERSSHIPPYTSVRSVGKAAKRHNDNLATMTAEERRTIKNFVKWCDEDAGHDYGIATEVVREFYGSLTQFLTRIAGEPGHGSFVGVGVSRILKSYHANLRFHPVKVKRKHGR